MSSGGGGEILALPAVLAVGAVAVAGLAIAGVAYGGAVVVAQAGKGLVACGRKLSQVLQERAAQQQALIQRSLEYDRQVQKGAHQAGQQAAIASQRRQQRLAQMQKLTLSKPQPAPQVELPPDPLLEPEPAPGVAVYDQADLEALAERMLAQADALERVCRDYQQPHWQGLIQVEDLINKIPPLRQEIKSACPARSEQAPSLHDLRRKMDELRLELAYRLGNVEALQRQREKTAEAISNAARSLQAQEQVLAAQAGAAPNLEAAHDMLEQAAQAYEQGQFELARRLAQAAGDYSARLSASLEETRRINLQAALDSLRRHVEEYGLAAGDPQTLPVRQGLAQAEQHLRSGRLDECGQILEQLQPEIKRLAQQVEENLLLAQQASAVRLFAEALGEMSYRLDAPRHREDGVVELKAVRADGAYFLVLVGPDGNFLYKTEKFNSKECGSETRRLFERLREKGMAVRTQTEYTAEDVAERMTETMLRLGYLYIQKERLLDGRILIKGARSGGEVSQEAVGHDLEPEAPGVPGTQAAAADRLADLPRVRRSAQQKRREDQRRRANHLRRSRRQRSS